MGTNEEVLNKEKRAKEERFGTLLKEPNLNLEMLNSIMRKSIGGGDQEYEYHNPPPVGEKMMKQIKQKAIYTNSYHPDSEYADSQSTYRGEKKGTESKLVSPNKASIGIEHSIVRASRT